MGIQRISPGTYYMEEGQAIVQFATNLADDFDKGEVKKVTRPDNKGALVIMSWGKDNNLPQVREGLVSDNNIVPSLIERKRNILVGQEIMAYSIRYDTTQEGHVEKKMEEVEIPTMVQDWLDGDGWSNGSNFSEYLAAAAGEWVKHSLVIPEFTRIKRDKTSIGSIEVKECKYMRAAKKGDSGRIERWYWSGHWGKLNDLSNKLETRRVVELPVYTGEINKQPIFIRPSGDYLLNDGYYPIPTWWGGWEWIELANQIPNFHRKNLENGYNIRWHIQIPQDYFLDYEKYQAAATEAEQSEILKDSQAREQAFMDDVNEFLAGLANVGRTLFTKYEMDKSLGKEYPGIKIMPLNYDMKDEALLKLFERSNTANTSAQGLHPSLAGIETQGKLSSGTEIRNAFLMWLIINTPIARKHLLSPLNLVKKINGWPKDIHFAIRDYELTSLAADPSGMQQRQDPTFDTSA